MPTPSQPRVTFETPLGTGELRDTRNYKDDRGPHSREDLAYAYFDKLTVNRKEYTNLRFALKRGRKGEDRGWYFWNDNYSSGLTASAQDKIQEALGALDEALIAPYLEDLDDATKRAQLKHDMTYEIKQGLYKVAPNRYHRGEDFEEKNALIDEILADLIARRAAGTDWGTIYFDDDIKKGK